MVQGWSTDSVDIELTGRSNRHKKLACGSGGRTLGVFDREKTFQKSCSLLQQTGTVNNEGLIQHSTNQYNNAPGQLEKGIGDYVDKRIIVYLSTALGSRLSTALTSL